MSNRISIKEIEPAAYTALMVLEDYGKTTHIEKKLRELIKIRASQLNGCAYCIDMHTEDALELGESARKIFALSAWKESHLFSEEERAVLQFTEEVTFISQRGVTDDTYNRVVNLCGERITVQILMQVVLINAWNRIAITSHSIYKP